MCNPERLRSSLTKKCTFHRKVMVGIESECKTEERDGGQTDSSSNATDISRSCFVRDQGSFDQKGSWEGQMAEAFAFLFGALASLQSLESEKVGDPKTTGVLASVCRKVSEALTTLDNFNMAQWTGSGFNADADCLLTALPTWSCLHDLDQFVFSQAARARHEPVAHARRIRSCRTQIDGDTNA
jgi:hypothetical protein